MKCLCTPQDIQSLGTILSVWAHPDDETYSCAGIMVAALQNGQRVVCVTATKGEEGVQDESRWPQARLAAIRTKEMSAALKALGIAEHHWLGYHDGTLLQVPHAEGVRRIKQFISDVQPDTILTFGPDGLTGHPDHQTVSHWVDGAVRGTDINVYHVVQDKESYDKYLKDLDKQFDIFFNIDKPPLYLPKSCSIALELTPSIMAKKRLALESMPSQTEGMLKSTPTKQFNEMFGCECFVRAD